MGCVFSRDKALMDCFKAVQKHGEAWREHKSRPSNRQVSPRTVGLLETLITALGQLREKCAELKLNEGSAEWKLVMDVGHKLSSDIVDMVVVRLPQRVDNGFCLTLLGLAEKLEATGVENVRARILERRKNALMALGTDELTQAEASLKSVSTVALKPLQEVLQNLKAVSAYIQEVPELVDRFFACCKVLGNKTENALSKGTVATEVTKLQAAWDLCRTVDDMIAKLMSLSGREESSWEWLLPKVQKVAEVAAQEMLPGKLKALEAEVNQEPMKRKELISCLKNVATLWVAPSLSDQGRLENCLGAIKRQIKADFEEATKSGKEEEKEDLTVTAGHFDKQCQTMQSNLKQNNRKKGSGEGQVGGGSLAQILEQVKARMKIKTLLADADEMVCRAKKRLHELYQKAYNQTRNQEKMSLKERVANAKWSFKLADGSFKAYAADKSEEVEAHYLKWKQGNMAVDLQTMEIQILVDGRVVTRKRREPCKYGADCYNKAKEHRARFYHPGEYDEQPPDGSLMRAETYTLDFKLMTQCRKGPKKAMRNLKREEAMTMAQTLVQEYYDEFISFLQRLEKDFCEEAEEQIRILGEEGIPIQKQVERIMEEEKEPLSEMLSIAAYCLDDYSREMIGKVEELLGDRGESLGVKASVKNLYMADFLKDLEEAFPQTRKPGMKGWDLPRYLTGFSRFPRQRLLIPRLRLVETKKLLQQDARRKLSNRCLALLKQHSGDEAFARDLRERAVDALTEAARVAAEAHQLEEIITILDTAVAWECSVQPIEDVASRTLVNMIECTLKLNLKLDLNPTLRLSEIMQMGRTIIRTSRRDRSRTVLDLHDFDLMQLLKPMVTKVLEQIEQALAPDAPKRFAEGIVVENVGELRASMPDDASRQAFDQEFWDVFKQKYEGASTEETTRLAEWAIPYQDHLGQEVPSWMMSREQVTASNRLEVAVNSRNEQELRKAVVNARLANIPACDFRYSDAVERLRELRQLPRGWDIDKLVGPNPVAPGFAQVNLNSEVLKGLFQSALSGTKHDIKTRDRKDGDVPLDFKVESITAVQNEDTWLSYMKRKADVVRRCEGFPEVVPCTDDVWQSTMGGLVETHPFSGKILEESGLPELDSAGNEFLLFHGTNPKAAESIALKHFDMRLACKDGLFGPGIYFAESSSKADEYAKPDKEGLFPLIVCRVSLGHINYNDEKSPGKDRLQASCALVGGDYHSVLGDRRKVRKTYREFIVYHPQQVYPHFIVWYQRIRPDS